MPAVLISEWHPDGLNIPGKLYRLCFIVFGFECCFQRSLRIVWYLSHWWFACFLFLIFSICPGSSFLNKIMTQYWALFIKNSWNIVFCYNLQIQIFHLVLRNFGKLKFEISFAFYFPFLSDTVCVRYDCLSYLLVIS